MNKEKKKVFGDRTQKVLSPRAFLCIEGCNQAEMFAFQFGVAYERELIHKL